MTRKSSSSGAAETHITAARHQHNGLGTEPAADEPGVTAARGPVTAWLRFWFTPVDPRGLHVLRALSGLLFAFWLLSVAGHQHEFFALGGFLDPQAYKEISRMPGGPPAPFGWSILYLCGTDATLVNLAYWGSVAVLLLFAAGVATRVTSILAWVIVVSFVANPVVSYDADYLLVILAFYLMIGYVLLGLWSRPLPPASRLLGPPDGGVLALLRPRTRGDQAEATSYAANLALRLIQVHFALIIFTAGLHKLQLGDWWAGSALWYPLHPPLRTSHQDIRSDFGVWETQMIVLSLIAYATLAWQLAFPLFAWRPRWRPLLLGGVLVGWLGCALIYGLPVFGPVLVLAGLSYLTPAEWRQGLDRLVNRSQALLGWLRPAPAGVGKSTKVGT